MKADAERTPGVVDLGPREAGRIRGPDGDPDRRRRHQRVGPGRQIAHEQLEAFRSVVVGGPRGHATIGRDADPGEAEIRLARRLDGFGQDDGVLAGRRRDGVTPRRRSPQPHAVLAAGFEAPPIIEVAVADRHPGVIVLHPALQLGEQRVDQIAVRREPGVERGVFGGEMGEDGSVVDRRIAGVAQPVIRVVADDAVVGGGVRNTRGLRGLGHHRDLARGAPGGYRSAVTINPATGTANVAMPSRAAVAARLNSRYFRILIRLTMAIWRCRSVNSAAVAKQPSSGK